ncbi:orc1/cdc6 family replication initiation protein [Halospeciosus flavus]|uniref:ORC1-type DNA replication protein n=1 Tax=Halospeciosus flavus TaxID=3032283 RepID=A0ABD5Z256_9EURY|nr:orc1/cdc6 family replication initiation protein [Halospeciosus flavus]
MGNPFEELNEVFVNRDVLNEEYQPDEILEREEEKQAYAGALRPITKQNAPNNIFLYGKTGVGKTVVTKYMLRKLNEQLAAEEADEVTTIWQNCRSLTSSYQVAVGLVNQLRETGEQLPDTGLPSQTVYRSLYEELEAIGGTILIVLDEIDAIGSDDDLLYELPRARANGKLEGTRVGVIGISNDYRFREQLSPQVKDTLCEKEITFSPYDATELRTILTHRAERALVEDTYDAAVINQCAALAAKDSGSARQAIELLREGGDIATERDGVITEQIIAEAQKNIERGKIKDAIKDLTVHGKHALLALSQLTEDTGGDVRTKEVYQFYEYLCEYNGTDPLVSDRLRDQLDDLAMLGFASKYEHNEGRRGGRYNTYESNQAVGVVQDVLVDIELPDERYRQQTL